ncbi:hypothetical protein [Streptomyces sp. SP18CS02]|uniref:hypothetical protein n=1 Tax=Streptomyces sp. SP18CS02 TaxID=3002531 RepID=UPI002E75E6ED|nr:hypothetical protein [Streptomyces sp. SP18CS02]MEE1752257.1 hypothetical protein [Streptomyces sp. SP18CS02]
MLRAGFVGLVVCLGATACGGTEDGEKERTAAEEQCGGVLSRPAVSALQRVMSVEKFSNAGPGRLTETVAQLRGDYDKNLRWSHGLRVCQISTDGGDVKGMRISFALYAPEDLPGGRHAAGLHAYPMGKEALAGAKRASLYFECVSPELKGSSSRPARILGSLSYWKPPQDSPATRDANLTVLHSVSLAVAKELKCERNADLPTEPELTPID